MNKIEPVAWMLHKGQAHILSKDGHFSLTEMGMYGPPIPLYPESAITALQSENAELKRQLEEASKDAERWRAYRSRDEFGDLDFTHFQDQFRDEADEVIDAAIKAQGGKE